MQNDKYTCIVCGNQVDALFRQYGPTVLKVSNCDQCGSVADKYIEYDPVIVMVDIVLLSKQAYRHVLYNTPFKIYWKLFIILILMETYVHWSQETMFKKNTSSVVEYNQDSVHSESLCSDNGDDRMITNAIDRIDKTCESHQDEINRTKKHNVNSDDPFLTEKGIYLTFCCVSCGMVIYVIIAFVTSIFFRLFTIRKNKVDFILLLKALTLGGMGNLLMIPSIIWGGVHDTTIHAFLVWGYTMLALLSIHSVVFDCSKWRSLVILTISAAFKQSVTSYLKTFSNILI